MSDRQEFVTAHADGHQGLLVTDVAPEPGSRLSLVKA